MAFSVVRYTGNFSQTAFSIPFGYMVTSHIKVQVNGVQKILNVDYTVSGGTLTFTTAPAMGHVIIIWRDSSQAQLMTEYQDGVTLTKGALSVDSSQAFYMAQEALDGFGSGENFGLSTVGSFWDAQSRQIKNVGAPTDPNDAATKGYVDGLVSTTIAGSGYVQKTGDTMTGALVLPGNPTAALQAAPKQYVDAQILANASPVGLVEPYGGFLVRNPLPSSDYAFRQWVDATLSNPYPGVNTPATGANGVASVDMLTTQQYLSTVTFTSGSFGTFATTSLQWPTNAALGQWIFLPVMFSRTAAIRYIATEAFQTGSGVFGNVRIQVFASSPTTYAPTTMLSDGGIQTLPVNNGSPNYPAAGTYLTCPVVLDAVAGTQYWVALNFCLSNGTFSNTIGFQVGLTQFTQGMQLSTRPIVGGTSNKLPFWWGTSQVTNTTSLTSNPGCTNIFNAGNSRVPKLYFMT